MAELKRLFASLENAELAHKAYADGEHALILNQLHALSAYSHLVKHKYLTTMKDTFAGRKRKIIFPWSGFSLCSFCRSELGSLSR